MLNHRFARPFLAILALSAAPLAPTAHAQSALQANPFSLNVNFQRNTPSGNAFSRAIELTNIFTRVTVTTTTDGPSNVNWLFVNPTVLNANEGATRRIDVTFLPGPLNPGGYTGTVRFTPDGGGTVLVVPVSLFVSDSRLQNAVPSSLEFVVQRNSPQTAPTQISLTATTGTLGISAVAQSSPSAWLLVDSGPVTTPSAVGVRVSPANLLPGEYTGTITLTATGNALDAPGNPTLTIPVRMRVVDDSRAIVAPDNLAFDFQLNGPVPAARTVAVTSTGASLNFQVEIATPGTSVAWLTATPAIGATPQNLSIGLQNLGNLPAGTFTGTVTIRTSNNLTAAIAVTLRVATDPLLSVTPGQLTFTFQQGGSQPPRQTLIASNFGNPAAVAVTAVGTSAQWIAVVTPSATTPAAIVIGVNPQNLSAGTYEGQVELRGSFGNSPLVVPVRLVIGGANTSLLRISQNRLNFAFQTGSSTATLTQSIDVTATGAAIQYAATSAGGTGWLAVTPVSSQATPSAVAVAVTPGSLPPGVYNATVSVQTPEQGAVPYLIPVRMVISTQSLLNVTPAALSFSATNATGTLRQSIAVSSTGSNIAYQAASAITGGAGNWLVAVQSGAATPSTVEVGVNPIISEGSGIITITAPGIENSPVFVPVTLSSNTPVSQLTVAPTVIRFNHILSAPVPAAQSIDITAGQGAGLLGYRVGDIRYLNGTGWLKLSKTAGIAPDKLDVTIDPANLPAGLFAASIPFESTAAPGVVVREVSVFLEVTQVVNAFTASPDTLTFNFTPGALAPPAQTIQLGTTSQAVPFTAIPSVAPGAASWLGVTSLGTSTPAVLSVTATPGTLAPGTYQGTITVTGVGVALTRAINVTLNIAAGATPVLARLVSAASFLDVSAVPGMIVSLTGANLGPVSGVVAAPNAAGSFDRVLSNVRVIFDTIEAPILFVSAGQINAVVPYAVAARLTTSVRVEVNGVRSNAVELRVASSSPGIFVLSAAGQGAVLNQDLSVNGAANSAARDSVIVIYATGEGQTNPPGVDGSIPGRSTSLKTPVGRVRVRIGGQEAEVQYAGSAPFLVSGVLQLNVKVPLTAPTGPTVPVEVIVGDVSSQAGVTVAVR